MTEPPEWALREARRVQDEIMESPTVGEGDACRFIALALDAARRRGIKEDLRKQVLELAEALRLTIISKEDALARAAAENQKLRDELDGKRESWYTRYLAAAARATKAEEGLRQAIEALEYARSWLHGGLGPSVALSKVNHALARIKGLLPP